jgi:hypothetical protein
MIAPHSRTPASQAESARGTFDHSKLTGLMGIPLQESAANAVGKCCAVNRRSASHFHSPMGLDGILKAPLA